MNCSNCKSDNLTEMTPIAMAGGKVRLEKEIAKNKFEKEAMRQLVACVCNECGHVDFWVADKSIQCR